MSEYEKQLEKRISELEDIISKSIVPSVYGVLKYLIDEKRKHVVKLSPQLNMMSNNSIFRDIMSIRFNLGRQAGHTSALEKIHKENPTSLFACYYRNSSSGVEWQKFKSLYTGKKIQTDLILADDFLYEENRVGDLIGFVGTRRDMSLPHPIIVMT